MTTLLFLYDYDIFYNISFVRSHIIVVEATKRLALAFYAIDHNIRARRPGTITLNDARTPQGYKCMILYFFRFLFSPVRQPADTLPSQ